MFAPLGSLLNTAQNRQHAIPRRSGIRPRLGRIDRRIDFPVVVTALGARGKTGIGIRQRGWQKTKSSENSVNMLPNCRKNGAPAIGGKGRQRRLRIRNHSTILTAAPGHGPSSAPARRFPKAQTPLQRVKWRGIPRTINRLTADPSIHDNGVTEPCPQ